ncbi:MAG: hypothetical protein MUF53_01385 [Gemmatimonadaceae bacterium]|jgi:ABC-type transporter Mla MlaB component|nr:hypothetical protein [Gemmatimonadaceae bacterium]
MTSHDPIVERHPAGATVYLFGTLTERLALRTLDLLHLLPAAVRKTRIDLHGIDRFDQRGVGTLSHAVSHWQLLSGGEAIVTGADAVLSLHP